MGALSLPIGFLLRAIPVPERHIADILHLQQEKPKRVLRHEFVQWIDGEEVPMYEAKLLPPEEALKEIEEEIKRKEEIRLKAADDLE